MYCLLDQFFWGFFFGMMILLDNYFLVFSFLKFLSVILFLGGFIIYAFFFYFYKMGNLTYELSDFIYLYWGSGFPVSSQTFFWGFYNFYESSWLELIGPKSSVNLSSMAVYFTYFEKSFFSVIYLFLGVLLIYFFILSLL